MQQCEFSCKLRKLLAISEVNKPVLRKELFSVYIIIFLSIFLYWLLLETLKWDGWGSVWPICWVHRKLLFCSEHSTNSHPSVNDNLPLSYQKVKNPKTHRIQNKILKTYQMNSQYLQKSSVLYIVFLILYDSQGKKTELVQAKTYLLNKHD